MLNVIKTISQKTGGLLNFVAQLHQFKMNQNFINRIAAEVDEIEKAGLYKKERIITSDQGAEIIVGGKNVLNF